MSSNDCIIGAVSGVAIGDSEAVSEGESGIEVNSVICSGESFLGSLLVGLDNGILEGRRSV